MDLCFHYFVFFFLSFIAFSIFISCVCTCASSESGRTIFAMDYATDEAKRNSRTYTHAHETATSQDWMVRLQMTADVTIPPVNESKIYNSRSKYSFVHYCGAQCSLLITTIHLNFISQMCLWYTCARRCNVSRLLFVLFIIIIVFFATFSWFCNHCLFRCMCCSGYCLHLTPYLLHRCFYFWLDERRALS